MEGTLSARPEGVVVPTQGRLFDGFSESNAVAPLTIPQFLERWKHCFHASAAMLATTAALAHMLEEIPTEIAPACAILAAILAVLTAGVSWTLERICSEKIRTDLAATDSAVTKSVPTGVGAARPRGGAVPIVIHGSTVTPNLSNELAQAAAMAQLTARISHDLRTPLNAVIGFSELMSQETFGPLGSQRYQDYAKHIRECGRTLLKSTEDTLAITSALTQPVSNKGSAGQHALSLAILVAEAWECVKPAAFEKQIEFNCEVPASFELSGDRRVMRQILVNLFQDASSRAGSMARISVGALISGHGIQLTIETHGCHDTNNQDTLSLSVARALLELHGLPRGTTQATADSWQVTVNLERSLQPDFFSDARHQSALELAV